LRPEGGVDGLQGFSDLSSKNSFLFENGVQVIMVVVVVGGGVVIVTVS
jgi:hypothetical protein